MNQRHTGPDNAPTAPEDQQVAKTLRAAAKASLPASAAVLRGEALRHMAADDPDRPTLETERARSLLVIGSLDAAGEAAAGVTRAVPGSPAALRAEVTGAFAAAAREGSLSVDAVLDRDQIARLAQACVTDEDRSELAHALIDHAVLALVSRHRHRAFDAADAALQLTDSDLAVASATMVRAACLADTTRYSEALADVAVVMDLAHNSPESFSIAGYAPWMIESYVLRAVGDVPGAVAAVMEGLRTTATAGLPFWRASLLRSQAAALLAGGQWDVALATAQAVSADGTNQMWSASADAISALIHARRGDAEAAATALDRWPLDDNDLIDRDHVLWAAATMARYRRDPSTELQMLRRARAWFSEFDDSIGPLPIVFDLMRAEMAAGNVARASELAAHLEPVEFDPLVAARHPDAPAICHALHTAAVALTAGKAPAIAAAAARLANAFPFESARLYVDAARVLRRSTAAQEWLEAADILLERLGAVAEQRLVAEWAASESISFRRAVTHVLSSAEQRVADLARRGMSNKAIAATLELSARTVEKHLTRIYAKTGVVSRNEFLALPINDG